MTGNGTAHYIMLVALLLSVDKSHEHSCGPQVIIWGRQPKHTILSYNCALKVLSRFTSKRNSDTNLIELCTNSSSQNGNLDYQDSTLLHNARQVSITSKITQSVCKRCQIETLHFLYLYHVCNPCIYQYYHLTA